MSLLISIIWKWNVDSCLRFWSVDMLLMVIFGLRKKWDEAKREGYLDFRQMYYNCVMTLENNYRSTVTASIKEVLVRIARPTLNGIEIFSSFYLTSNFTSPTMVEVHAHVCPTLWPMDCSLPVSSVHGIFRQEYWSKLLFTSSGNLPNIGIKHTSLLSPALVGEFFTTSSTCDRRCPYKFSHFIISYQYSQENIS